MFRRPYAAALAAVIFTVAGSAAILATGAPALADRDDHSVRHPHPAHRASNPYGANGYWSNGAWHNRLAANPGRHRGWNHVHPKTPKRRADHDGR